MAGEISLEMLAKNRAAGGQTDITVQKTEDIGTVKAQVEQLSPEQRARVEDLKGKIDLMDSQTAIQYGVGAQRNVSDFADNILAQVRSKDSGYVGELMSDLAIKVKDTGVDKLDEGFLDKAPSCASPSGSCSTGTGCWRPLSPTSSSA